MKIKKREIKIYSEYAMRVLDALLSSDNRLRFNAAFRFYC